MTGILRPCVIIVVAVAMAASTVTSATASQAIPAGGSVADQIRAEADWILDAQLEDGAIPHYADQVKVIPYWGNFAAMGLARATGATGDATYAEAAWRWIDWYAAHQSADGFITDYDVHESGVSSTGDMDSTDAYAATFLMAVSETFRATGDRGHLRRSKRAISGAVAAIDSTQDSDGLTWAKPGYRWKYLMDQAEVYAGLRHAVGLAPQMRDYGLARHASSMATGVRNGVEDLWNESTTSFDWAVDGRGWHLSTDWDVFYSDALQQVWAVAFGVTTRERAGVIMDTFLKRYPNWADPHSVVTNSSGEGATGFVPIVGWAFRGIGMCGEARSGAEQLSSAAAKGRLWPYTTGNAGQLIMLLHSVETCR